MTRIRLGEVTKVHRDGRGGGVRALDRVNLEVGEGETLVVVGPSGAGKTTLLRLVAGLEEASSGKVELGGRWVGGIAEADRGVALVFQDHPLFPHLDVEGNLALGLELRGVGAGERRDRVEEALGWLGLGSLRRRRPEQISGGERQRVALAMAVVRRPSVLLLDEPLAHLDMTWRLALRRDLRALQRRLGWTCVLVTHDASDALALADRLVVLQGGRVRQVGRPQEVYDRPADRFVAGFLGAPPMNLFEGRWEAGGSGAGRFWLGEGVGFEFGGSPGPWWEAGAGVERVLGVRSEAVVLEPALGRCGAGAGEGVGEGEVGAVDRLGHESWVHVGLGGGHWLVARMAAAAAGVWETRARVRVRFPLDAVHGFDPGDGRALRG